MGMGSRLRVVVDVAVAGAVSAAMLLLYALAAGMVSDLDLAMAIARR